MLGAAGRRPRRAILPAPGSRAGGAKRGAKTMRPPPFVPSARKTRRFAKLSPPEPGAGFANGAFCKVRPLRPPLRRPQHDAGFIWPVRYQSGGCFIAISCFIWSVRYNPPHTPRQRMWHTLQNVSRVRAQSAPPQAAPLTQPAECALPCLCGVWGGLFEVCMNLTKAYRDELMQRG